MKKYNKEVIERYGNTEEYLDYEEKTKDYDKKMFDNLKNMMSEIFLKFSNNLKENIPSSDMKTIELVSELKKFLSDNFFYCSNEVLLGIANTYVCDNRFKEFVDSRSVGTSEYVLEAVKYYCK